MKIKNRKNIILIILIILLVIMTIGYSTLSSRLKVNGTSSITSDFNVLFTDITEGLMNEATTINKKINGPTTATFQVDLKKPGSNAEYIVTVENLGKIDATLESIEGITEANEKTPTYITFSLEGINERDSLNIGETKTFKVKVTYNESATEIPDESKQLTLKLNYVQKSSIDPSYTYFDVKNEQELKDAISKTIDNVETTINVNEDISLNESLVISGNKNIKLTSSNNNTISLNDNFSGENIFEIEDGNYISLSNITINGGDKSRLFLVKGNSTLELNENGVLTNGYSVASDGNIASGGAVSLQNEGSTFIMNDGIVENNVATKYGGGIYTWAGNIEINDGIIRNNTGSYAGGIASLAGTLNLYGGQIINNKGTNGPPIGYGGGVFINKGVKVQLKGDVVINNNFNNLEASDLYVNWSKNEDFYVLLTGKFTGSIGVYKYQSDINQLNGLIYFKGTDEYTITEEDLSHFYLNEGVPGTLKLENNQIVHSE